MILFLENNYRFFLYPLLDTMFRNTCSSKNFRFLICRHGESVWNFDNKFTGWSNISLTEKGKFDAFKIGSILDSNKLIPNTIYTSDSLRAIDTAKIIKNTIREDNIPIISNWRLNEKHYGSCEGLERNFIKERYGEYFLDRLRKDFYIKPPSLDGLIIDNLDSFGVEGGFMKRSYYEKYKLKKNGENLHMVSNRIFQFLNYNILDSFKDNDLPLIVTHKHPIRVIFKLIKNMSVDEFEEFDPDNKTIYYVSFDGLNNVLIKNLKMFQQNIIL